MPRSSSATRPDAIEHLQPGRTAPWPTSTSAGLWCRAASIDEALKAFEKAEKAGYTASQVQLQRAGISPPQGRHRPRPGAILDKLEDQASHNAEYHFQLGMLLPGRGRPRQGDRLTSRRPSSSTPATPAPCSSSATPTTSPATTTRPSLYYERCLKHPPVHVGTLMNLGVLYEDHEQVRQGRRMLSPAC